MLKLPQVTLVAMSCNQVKKSIKALQYSSREIEFGEIVLITHKKPRFLSKKITFGYIPEYYDINGFNYNMIYKLKDYIKTEFALVIHYDGFVVNPDSWQSRFLEYDYIGSPFPLPVDDFSYRDALGNICRVGNSVSLRSKRLLDFFSNNQIPWESGHGYYNEDGFICCKNKHIIEANGMRIAPLDVAKYFGHESMIPEIQGIEPFVFHKWAGTNAIYPKF